MPTKSPLACTNPLCGQPCWAFNQTKSIFLLYAKLNIYSYLYSYLYQPIGSVVSSFRLCIAFVPAYIYPLTSNNFKLTFLIIKSTNNIPKQISQLQEYTMSTNAHSHIKDELIKRMLRLQQLFHQRFLTAELLNELIATYVEAIECFDGILAPMRKYFLQKIQYVVSQPQIDEMLKRNAQSDSMVGALRQTIRMTTDNVNNNKTDQVFSHAILMQAIELEQKKTRLLHEKNLKAAKEKEKQTNNNSNGANNFYIKSPQKQADKAEEKKDKKIEMQMNLMKQVSENMKNLQLEVKKQDKNFMKKTKRINALMQEQDKSLEARLAMRKRGKGRKKSGDERFVQQVKEAIPLINKQELKQAQKEIAVAVERMTARLTQRMGTNKGQTGMIVGTGEQKYRGRIKVRNQVREEDNQDQDDGVVNNNMGKDINMISNQNGNGGEKKQTVAVEYKAPQVDNQGTARFTLGSEMGGRGRIKIRDTKRLKDEDQD